MKDIEDLAWTGGALNKTKMSFRPSIEAFDE